MKKTFIIILFILISTYNYSQENLALNKTVSASNTHPSTKTESITDGNLSTSWNSGNFAPQIIIIDLNAEYDITKIKLTPLQDPAGSTTHEIFISKDMVNWEKADNFTLNTTNGVTIERTYSTPLIKTRGIKVFTKISPSWVAWNEIEVYGKASETLIIPEEERGFYVGSTDSFAQIVEESEYPVVVMFTTQWSEPCKAMFPFLKYLNDNYSDKVIVCELDIDENPEIAQKYKIRSVPTTCLFSKGSIVKTIIGEMSYQKLVIKLGL